MLLAFRLWMAVGPLLFATSPAEQQVAEAIKAPALSVVHLWAPWCSNCQAELKSGGWLKVVKDNPQVKFYFVSVWNSGDDGRAMLSKFEIAGQPNVTILADPGPRSGDKIKRFLDLPLSLDSDHLGFQRRRSALRVELRRSAFRRAPATRDGQ